MTCCNNIDINEFQPKGKDDMMQCVTRNKSFVCIKIKNIRKTKENTNIIVE